MAEPAKNTEEEVKEEGEQQVAPAEPPKPKPDVLGFILLLLVVLNIGAMGVMGYFMLKMWDRVHVLQQEGIAQFVPEEPEEEPVGKELEAKNLGVLYPLDPFLVNLPGGSSGPKFLQTQVELELADPSVEDEVSMKKAAIRDAIIVLLTSRSYEELRKPSGMASLRQALLNSINQILNTGKVKQMYFTQFHFN